MWGVITNDETHDKIGFDGDVRLFPVLSIIDPEPMKTVPPAYTAYQRFDALFHSTESYISCFASQKISSRPWSICKRLVVWLKSK